YAFFFSSRRRHTRSYGDWSSDVCSSDLRRQRILQPKRRVKLSCQLLLQLRQRQSARAQEQQRIFRRFNDRGDSRPRIAEHLEHRSEERRVGKSVDLGGRRNIRKKK